MNSLLSAFTTFTAWVQPRIMHYAYMIPLNNRIIDLTFQHFTFLQNSCLLGMGVKTLTWDRIKLLSAPSENLQSLFVHTFPAVEKTKEYYDTHGYILTYSGILGIAGLFLESTLLNVCSHGLFSIGNIVAIKYNVEVFMHTTDDSQRKSAALGIASNLGYILATAAALLTAPAFLALLFGCLALCCGGIKILYDALLLNQGEQPVLAVSDASS